MTTCHRCGAPLVAGHSCTGTRALDSLTVAMPGPAHPSEHEATTQPAGLVPPDLEQTRLAADPLLPDVVGGFRLEFVAGTGGMGTVYRAFDERLGTPVAVKVMKRSALNDPRALERAHREVTAAARVQHVGIAPVLGSGQLADGRPWFATPFLDGQALDGLLRERGALPWALVVPVLDALAAVLGAAHSAGVVHRDVKPANVFCAKQSDGTVVVKLLDFGLALLGDATAGIAQTGVQSLAGTAEFIAPEQALGQRVDARADLYAFGITAFQLLTGKLPYSDVSSTGIMRQHVLENAPRVSEFVDVPRALDRLVADLLARQPAARPASTSAVRERLVDLRFVPPQGDGLLERLARMWAAAHPPTLGATMRRWLAR